MEPVANAKPFVLVIVTVPLLATVLAVGLLFRSVIRLSDLVLLATMYTVTACGLSIGYHRMLTHRSLRASSPVKIILLILGCMAVTAPPFEWAATHIKHHSQSDRDEDPHSAVEGLFHSHVRWLFRGLFPDPRIYYPHLLADTSVVLVNRTFLLGVALSLAIPFVIGGWTGLLWGGLVRICLGHHVTFSVNSICHTFGRRAFETNECSRNQWIVGVLAFGEGWHNNHHAFPRSAFHGLHWWQVDLAGYVIWTLERIGLVYDVHRISPAVLARSRLVGAFPTSSRGD
jgi:stearoyl-CoA desaturase (Delta-9 desaturase)